MTLTTRRTTPINLAAREDSGVGSWPPRHGDRAAMAYTVNPSREQLSVALGDRYVIERELGRGGMATVYLARDVKHDRSVAIKVLKPELAAGDRRAV
ncbi:MAG: hypothetical protein ABR543_16055 [Gemmatimonadaceae bacterium]